jgi:endonuclease YncB( thermonuclease family)
LANAFFTIASNPRLVAGIRREADDNPESLKKSISDGDTLGLHVSGSGSIRFLGIDSPEKNIALPGTQRGRSLGSPEWDAYLANPFADGTFGLEQPLLDHLTARIDPGAGANHRHHGELAEKALIALVQADMDALGQTLATFQYFVSFSYEVFDSYGRFLAFINRNQPDDGSPRPLSYNERMLEAGRALPYFIWPNIDPFRKGTILDAVLEPGTANTVAEGATALRRARTAVKQARANGIGVFDPANPLRFEAFEVRFFGKRLPPNRPLIDLSRNDNVILRPQSYYRVPNPEDRLFLPPQFTSLFLSKGWQLEG